MKKQLSRRESLMSFGAMGAAFWAGDASGIETGSSSDNKSERSSSVRSVHQEIAQRVRETSFVDTHEHLFEESTRLHPSKNPISQCDDWALLIWGYLFSDLVSAGLPNVNGDGIPAANLFQPDIDPLKKWKLIEPYWKSVRHTGYALAVRLSIQALYGVDDFSETSIPAIQAGYERTRQPGFYRKILCDIANIESCQVNGFAAPFVESQQPQLLMQDLNALAFLATPRTNFFSGWSNEATSQPTGIHVQSLSDWHQVIDWWFQKYGRYAVAVKSQLAYSRDIDHQPVPAEKAEGPFQKILAETPLTAEEETLLEDHLFWYTANQAIKYDLPYKLHTGYYAGENRMPLSRLINNAGSACDLCRQQPDLKFVFMHICYPYYEELISVAKQYTNAYVDMCWAWIINPLAAKDFLKKYLVTAPANKILTFGADYTCVENVVGHAMIARQGITLALSELVEEGWLSLDEAVELIEPLMRGNARTLFHLAEKEQMLARAPWL
jgi:predicted TIM-barrel fold metal-dependent hydrolase